MLIEYVVNEHQDILGNQVQILVQRAQQGDSAAFSSLYEEFSEPIFRFLYYRLGDRQTAEDLTAEVFIRVIKSIRKYRPQQPFRAWLFRIARNLAIDFRRKYGNRHEQELDEAITGRQQSPEVATANTLNSDRLRQALEHLTPDQRDVIILRFIGEMRISEVADALNKSHSAVKSLQSRGLQMLSQVMGTELSDYDA